MVFTFEEQKVTLQELISGKISENILSPSVSVVVKFIKAWFDGQKYFNIHTSGSTGSPKSMLLSREKLTYSAKTSLDYLDPHHQFTSALLCINPQYIGGIMVMVRAIISQLDLTITAPARDITQSIKNHHFDLVSLVPLQIQHLLQNEADLLNRFKTVLIGGAPLSPQLTDQISNIAPVKCYHTYGMTETASHIALKNLSDKSTDFQTLGDVIIAQDERDCLKLKGIITDHQWLQTNDIVRINRSDSFHWLGRADFVINSGGVKIHPEQIESTLSKQLKMPFFVAGLPDDSLGEKAVLLIEGDSLPNIDTESLSKYQRPKETLLMKSFEYTASGKINRSLTLKKLMS